VIPVATDYKEIVDKMMDRIRDEKYKEQVGLKAGDLLLVVSIRNPEIRLVYKVDGYKKLLNDEKLSRVLPKNGILAVCLRRCSAKQYNYSDYVELPCDEFKVCKNHIQLQGHRVERITEKEALLEVL
jgi:hypothetical protein